MPTSTSDANGTRYVTFGATRGVWTILSFTGTLITAGAIWWLTTVQAQNKELDTKVDVVSAQREENTKRLSVIEAETKIIGRDIDHIRNSVNQINNKLDAFLLQERTKGD